MKETIKKFGLIIVGQFINTVAFASVLIPNNLVPVGFGGVATIFNNLFGWNILISLILFSLPILSWAMIKYNRTIVTES